jgi:purine-binding chemotaxis protein CheW
MSTAATTLDEILASRAEGGGAVVDVDMPTVKLVVFTLAGDWYAFTAAGIAEILPDRPVFFLPGCPPSLEGVISVRGSVESVIALRPVLGLPAAPPGAPSRILIGRGAALRSGLRVDTVEDVADVAEDTVLEPPHTIDPALRPLVRGVTTVRGHLVTVLDLERLLADYRAGLAG